MSAARDDMPAGNVPMARARTHGWLATPPEGLPQGRPAPQLKDFIVSAALRPRQLLAAFLVPVLLGLLAALMVPARWPAEALLLVRPGSSTAAVPDAAGNAPTLTQPDVARITRSELDILRSADVLRAAAAALGPGAPGLSGGFGALLAPLTGGRVGSAEERAVEALRRRLAAEVPEGSTTLRVIYWGEDPTSAAATLSAVLAAYRARREAALSVGNAAFLESEAERAGRALAALDEDIRTLLGALGVSDAAAEAQLVAQRLDAVRRREGEMAEQRVATEAQIAAARGMRHALPGRVVAQQEQTNQAANDESRNELTRLMNERGRMAAQYSADYPPLRDLDRRIAAARATLRDARSTGFAATREVRNPTLEFVEQRLAQLTLEGEAQARAQAELAGQARALEARLGALRDADVRLRALTRQREVQEQAFRQAGLRAAQARLEEEVNRTRSPTVQVVQQPAVPLRPRSLAASLIAAGVVAGGFAVLALIVLITLTRRSAATAEEAERGTGLPILAASPALGPEADPLGATPAGVADLAAMMLDGAALGARLQVVQLLAPEGGEAAHVAQGLALAVAFARDRGRRTLLIDLSSDGRAHLARLGSQPMRPDQPGENMIAFGTVLPKLWIAFEASKSALADAGSGVEQVAAALEELRAMLDVVVVLAPEGALDSYAGRRLAALVDANLLVLRAEHSPLDLARALRDRTLGSGGRLAGTLFCGERPLLPKALRPLLAAA